MVDVFKIYEDLYEDGLNRYQTLARANRIRQDDGPKTAEEESVLAHADRIKAKEARGETE